MRKLLNILLVSILIVGCNEVAPTLLTNESSQNNSSDLEAFNKTSTDSLSFAGYDSLGVTDASSKYENVFEITGTKNTYKTDSFYRNYYQAIFIDRTAPIHSGNKFMGYGSKESGEVYFNNNKCSTVPRFLYSGTQKINAGTKYIYSSGRKYSLLTANLPYNSNVKVSMKRNHGMMNSLEIPTPKRIECKLNIVNRKAKNFILKWNGADNGKIQVIIGGIRYNSETLLPYYRLNTKDDGELVIPESVIKTLPLNNLRFIVFTVIRELKGTIGKDSANKDYYYISQSIHNLYVDAQ